MSPASYQEVDWQKSLDLPGAVDRIAEFYRNQTRQTSPTQFGDLANAVLFELYLQGEVLPDFVKDKSKYDNTCREAVRGFRDLVAAVRTYFASLYDPTKTLTQLVMGSLQEGGKIDRRIRLDSISELGGTLRHFLEIDKTGTKFIEMASQGLSQGESPPYAAGLLMASERYEALYKAARRRVRI